MTKITCENCNKSKICKARPKDVRDLWSCFMVKVDNE
jgi:hypothetical protein